MLGHPGSFEHPAALQVISAVVEGHVVGHQGVATILQPIQLRSAPPSMCSSGVWSSLAWGGCHKLRATYDMNGWP